VQRLYQKTVIRKAGATAIPVPRGNLSLPTVTAGASTYWMGAGPPSAVTPTQPGFGRIDAISHKLACLIPITNDLLRFAVEALDEQLGEMLTSEIAVAEDLQFIRGQGYQNTPRGLAAFAGAASSSFYGGSNVVTSSGATPAQIVLDLQAAIYALLAASVGMIKPAWIMSPATSAYLQTLQNSDGLFIFKEMSLKGTLLRYPFFETIQIPTNLTVGSNSNCTEIYLFDAAEAMIFDGPGSRNSGCDLGRLDRCQ
jgi:HK97 family phage major capsid protein